MDNIYKLQNGSDIRGVAMEGVAGEAVNLNSDTAKAIAHGFVRYISRELHIINPKISVGIDSRLSGEELAQAVITGLKEAGAAKILYFGLCSTPAMFMSTKEDYTDMDAAIMLTASHLPYNRNGMKFFTKHGGTNKDDIREILELAQIDEPLPGFVGIYEEYPFINDYAEGLVRLIREATSMDYPLSGSKIIVDAGNGAGGFFAQKVLIPLGADTIGSVCLEPDGHFPNHIPNPENNAVMHGFCEAVKAAGADLGVIFDTDVDRAALVDQAGDPISRSKLIALISDIILSENPNSTIITDSVTSASLKPFIEARGGTHYRFKRGYNNVISEAIRLNGVGVNCPIAIETSGHCALRENDFLDDGAYLIVKLLIKYCELKKIGKKLSDALIDYHDPLEAKELRPKILAENFAEYAQGIIDDFAEYAASLPGWEIEQPNYEGIRVKTDYGWALMRKSLHEPELPINLEADKVGGVDELESVIMAFLAPYQLGWK